MFPLPFGGVYPLHASGAVRAVFPPVGFWEEERPADSAAFPASPAQEGGFQCFIKGQDSGGKPAYDPNYSAAVNICSAPTGILIPPSGPLILYSITAGGVSVAALFMGGYLPGILMGLCVAGLAIFIAVKKGYKSSDVKDPDPAIKVIIDAVPSLPADHPLWAEELGVTALRGMAAFPRKPNGGPIPADCCKTGG